MKKYIYYIILIILINNQLFSYNYEKVNKQAIKYSNQGLYDISDKLFNEIIINSIAEEKYNKTLDAYVSLGYSQIRQNNYVKAIKYYSDAIKFKEKYNIDNYNNLNYLYKQYAYANSFLGNHITSIEYYQKAQKFVPKNYNMKSYYNLKIDEITSLMYLGYYNKALKQLHNIEVEVLSFNDAENKIVLYLNKVDCYLKLNMIIEANNYMIKVKPLLSKTHEIEYKFNYELLKAQKYLLQKDTAIALDYLNNLHNEEWGVYNLNIAKLEKIKILRTYNSNLIKIDELKELETFYIYVDDKESLIEIYKIFLSMDNYNLYLDKYLKTTNNHLKQTKNYLNQALELHEQLNKDLIKITFKNSELEYQKKILIVSLIAMFIIFILSILLYNYIKSKQKVEEENTDYEDSNFQLKTNLTNLILEIQTHFFTNDNISKDFVLKVCTKLINYHKTIKE